MTLDEAVLAKLSEWRPAGAGPHAFRGPLAAPGWELNLRAAAADTLGCRLSELTVARPAACERSSRTSSSFRTGSMPRVGSSSTRRSGSATSTAASASRSRSPLERSRGCRVS